MKTKKAYILYQYNQFKNDYNYIKEYYNKNDIVKEYQLKNKNSLYHYIRKSIEEKKELLKDKFVIVVESVELES